MTDDSKERNSVAHRCVLILAGTTASGKTEVSIPLAELLKGEIVSADSRQIFRELQIGTAKPSRDQLELVPHHFVDEKSIRERWTAGDFSREARLRIEHIFNRNRVPIVVGGSMLYLKALMDGFYDEQDDPITDYVFLRKEAESVGLDKLYAELQKGDPELAEKIMPNDAHRILRGIAVLRSHERPLSVMQHLPRNPIPWPARLYFLYADRQETYDRVNDRVLKMVEQGLVDEVRELSVLGFDERNCNALRTHGYQEVVPYLRNEISMDQMIEDIQVAVRHYVKRQLTWFRHDPRAVWIKRDFVTAPSLIAGQIASDFSEYTRTIGAR